MACTACLVCFISTVNGHCNKKRKEKKKLTLGRPALVAGTQQTLSNLFETLDIYGSDRGNKTLNCPRKMLLKILLLYVL